MDSARVTDLNGYTTVKNNPISKSGVFQYLGRSIGAPDPDKIYNVYRPASAWEDPEALDSVKHVPLVDEHTMLGDGYTPPEEKGIHGFTCDNVSFDGNMVRADLKILSKSLKESIDSGKKSLSLGFRCRYTPQQGVFDGQTYDFIQDSLRANHVALVEVGRMGKDVVVLDQHIVYDDAQDILPIDKSTKELDMAEAANTGLDAAAVAEIVKTAMDAALAPVLTRLAAMDEKMDEDDKKDKAEDEDESEEEKAERMRKKKTGEDEDDEDMAEDKKSKGMDAAEVSALVQKETAKFARDAYLEQNRKAELAGKISAYVGAFDHSEMTLKQVAAYGREKLNLAETGADEAVLAGYFAAKPAPSASAAFTFDAKESASVVGAVNAYFEGK